MKTSRKLGQSYWLVFSDYAPNGVVCRDVDLKHWMDPSGYKVEVDRDMVDGVYKILDECPDQLPIGQMNKRLTKRAL